MRIYQWFRRETYYSRIKTPRIISECGHCERDHRFLPFSPYEAACSHQQTWMARPFFSRCYRGRWPLPLCECRIDEIACVPSIIYLPIAGDLAPSRPAIFALVMQVIDRSTKSASYRILMEKYYCRNCLT